MESEKNYELAILKLLEIIALLRKKQHNGETIFNELGLTESYFNILFIIENFDGISTSELSLKTGISIPNCSKALDTLFCNGLIVRENDTIDKRVYKIHLSEEGVNTIKQYKDSLKDRLREMTKRLDNEDISTLVNASNELVKVLIKLY